MKRKYLFLAVSALVAAGGWWLARTVWRNHEVDKPGREIRFTTPSAPNTSDTLLNTPAQLAPPDQTRRFRDFTPEQRVEFARKGHGPGG